MSEDKWAALQGEGYRLENLGRPAVFLLPSHKLRTDDGSGRTIGDALHRFLVENFGAYTCTTVPYFGFWHGQSGAAYDECRLYEVSFDGKEHIRTLAAKLAEVARIISEECIYFKAGQYACLVYPA